MARTASPIPNNLRRAFMRGSVSESGLDEAPWVEGSIARVVTPDERINKQRGGRQVKTAYSPSLGIARGAITVWGILGPGFRIRV